ncbi:MAG: inosine monophosphate cyclohydrolase [Clostridiales bacterium]|nr:inosine monophosphate cyclohydrolase [Clostridiales bacterium]
MVTIDICDVLKGSTYPGRGIIFGRSADNRHAVIAYFIMGRSVNSRNRVFVATEDGIRTQAYDAALMIDPSLIIYRPVRTWGGKTIVTNGDQTDTVLEYLARGRTFADALRTRTFEPDAPNYTPRISGIMEPDGSYSLSILKAKDGDPSRCCRFFFEYENPAAGFGDYIHTYSDDGSPLPSFKGEPESVAIGEANAQAFADDVWNSLNPENRVALFVRYSDLGTGSAETVIINAHERE